MNGLALCAGVGGIELGLKLALGDAYRTVCYVEREGFTAATLVARMEEKALDPAPIWDDLTTFNGFQWRGVVDIVSAGFPCQPFSPAKRGRVGAVDLWPNVLRVIRQAKPHWVFLENIPAAPWTQIKMDLDQYGCRTALAPAASVGAPHIRRRVFLLAHLDHEGECTLPIDDEVEGESVIGESWWDHPRMVDGVPPGVDEIRALGNGVVPLVAAHAFRTLAGGFK